MKPLNMRARLPLFLAALALVLQSVLTSVSSATAAPMYDAFGNVLCIGGKVDNSDQRHAPSPHECCLAACLSTAMAGPVPDTGILLVRDLRIETDTVASPAQLPIQNLQQSRPGNPRAPPVA